MGQIICTIECRMGSSRLAGKVMKKFGDLTIIEFMVERVRKSKFISDVVIATTTNKKDDAIEKLCIDSGISVFRGDENSVISRVNNALIVWNGDGNGPAVALSGDCPFVCPKMIDQLIIEMVQNDYDYISNDVVNRSYPDGLDIQVFKPEVLFKTYNLITDPTHYSHSAWNIPHYGSNVFKIGNHVAPEKYYWPELGLTLDEQKDYEFLCKIYDKFFKNDINKNILEVIDFLKENPDFITNQEVKRKIAGTDKFQGEF